MPDFDLGVESHTIDKGRLGLSPFEFLPDDGFDVRYANGKVFRL